MAAPHTVRTASPAERESRDPVVLQYRPLSPAEPLARSRTFSDAERFPVVVTFPRFDKAAELPKTPATFTTSLAQRLLETDIMFWVVLGIGILIAATLISGRVGTKVRPAAGSPASISNSAAQHKPETAPQASPLPPSPVPAYREPKIASSPSAVTLPDAGDQVISRPDEEIVTIPPATYRTLQSTLESATLTADRGQRASSEYRRDGAADTSGRAHFTGTILKIDAQPSNDSP